MAHDDPSDGPVQLTAATDPLTIDALELQELDRRGVDIPARRLSEAGHFLTYRTIEELEEISRRLSESLVGKLQALPSQRRRPLVSRAG